MSTTSNSSEEDVDNIMNNKMKEEREEIDQKEKNKEAISIK